MKTKIIFLFVFILVSGYVFAQSKTVKASIKVYGNCAMCKRRIETALDTKGIKAASWNTKTKQLEIIYQSDKITEKRIHEIISSVGHDTDQMKAKDDVYANLPFCCLYRDHDHSGMKDN